MTQTMRAAEPRRPQNQARRWKRCPRARKRRGQDNEEEGPQKPGQCLRGSETWESSLEEESESKEAECPVAVGTNGRGHHQVGEIDRIGEPTSEG